MSFEYKKGQIIKNVCHQCYYGYMKIYRVSNKMFIYCECLKCGAVDDITLCNDENPLVVKKIK